MRIDGYTDKNREGNKTEKDTHAMENRKKKKRVRDPSLTLSSALAFRERYFFSSPGEHLHNLVINGENEQDSLDDHVTLT